MPLRQRPQIWEWARIWGKDSMRHVMNGDAAEMAGLRTGESRFLALPGMERQEERQVQVQMQMHLRVRKRRLGGRRLLAGVARCRAREGYLRWLASFFWVSRKRRTRSRERALPKTTRDSTRGGLVVEPVRMARRSMKFSLTDHSLASPSCLRAVVMGSRDQSEASRVAICSRTKARVSSGVRFLGSYVLPHHRGNSLQESHRSASR